MALDDLDLEFEDEEEVKKKKSEAVQVDVDLEFHSQAAQAGGTRSKSLRPGEVNDGTKSGAIAEVKKLDDARPAAHAKKATPGAIVARSHGGNAAASRGGAALRISNDEDTDTSDEVSQLREQLRRTEVEAELKVQLAEFKSEIMIEILSDMKMVDHRVNQILLRINAKHPELKQEMLMIKKILADFTAKKRK